MATSMNKKKTTTAKTTVEKVNSVERDNKTVAENIKEEKPKKREFEPTDLIPCRSITVGLLVMTGVRSGNPYSWFNNGDIIDVEYRDLKAMVMMSDNQYIYRPCFIVEDEDFLNENPKLKDFYDSMYTTTDLRSILKIPNISEMVNVIKSMPKGCLVNLRDLAVTMVMNHEIDSIKRVKTLEDVLDVDLSMGFNN